MKVGVGYSDNPDTAEAGLDAARSAVAQSGRQDECSLALLFTTARHDQAVLREAVSSVIGVSVPIYGGGAAGVITNEFFGYAGDQIGIACLWLDGVGCEVLTDGGLLASEEDTGFRLGQRLAELGTAPQSPVMLFYDALGRDTGNGMRTLMATWLLAGLEKGLGFLPDLTGAGLMGDHIGSPTRQWTGDKTGSHQALAMAFYGDLRIDSAIMHGCRPATDYYTVTKADGPVILEINGQPAITFMDKLLAPGMSPKDYPFTLIFGINHGERWGDYDENLYASRLCLGLDEERGGIVMFEPDMVAGTEFQLMFRSFDLKYMQPKIDALFTDLDGREPVFAMYIDCAGRCAGYAGMDLEDALIVQKAVAGRVPLLGLYTGVEIASIGGKPRGLDWTGVFCLFSQGKGAAAKKTAAAWAEPGRPAGKQAPVDAVLKLCEQDMAKILALDTQSVALRHELEQKRRGFSLLAELSVSLRRGASYDNVFIPAAKRLNATLNMQRTVVLLPDGSGQFKPAVLQGYSPEGKSALAGHCITVPEEFFNPERPVLITGADDRGRFAKLRTELALPYFIATPIILQKQVAAILITGRLSETPPYFLRLDRNDMETVQAIGTLLASVLASQRLTEVEERHKILLDAMPMSCIFWDEHGNRTDCNREALDFFGLPNKADLLERFPTMSPEYQPDGSHSETTAQDKVLKSFVTGHATFDWTFQTADGELLPSEVTLVRVPRGENYIVAGYIQDIRKKQAYISVLKGAQDLAERQARVKSEFLAMVSHEIRTPLNAILAMARAASDSKETNPLIEQGLYSAQLLSTAIDNLLDFAKIDAGQAAVENAPFSVRDMINSLAESLRGDAQAKALSLTAECRQDIPDFVIGDAGHLRQTLFNIAMNAIKFTEKGGVSIDVYPEELPLPGKIVLNFEVRDTGIGLTPQQIDNLFKPLTPGDTSFTRKYSGMGMGLAISGSLATLMGGAITCESRLGEGSKFTLSVPLALPEEKEQPDGNIIKPEDYRELRGLKVLVAEDNAINQMIAEELLTNVGIDVTLADNGLTALSALRSGRFDVVLMDIQMPEMDGLTATAQIRADSRYDDIPILAMTANASAEHKAESFKAGMNEHLSKPIDAPELYAALQKWGRRGVTG